MSGGTKTPLTLPRSALSNPSFAISSTVCLWRTTDTNIFGIRAFSVADHQSGIHCLIICAIQLLTPKNLGRT